jgi:hypothetical protein
MKQWIGIVAALLIETQANAQSEATGGLSINMHQSSQAIGVEKVEDKQREKD